MIEVIYKDNRGMRRINSVKEENAIRKAKTPSVIPLIPYQGSREMEPVSAPWWSIEFRTVKSWKSYRNTQYRR